MLWFDRLMRVLATQPSMYSPSNSTVVPAAAQLLRRSPLPVTAGRRAAVRLTGEGKTRGEGSRHHGHQHHNLAPPRGQPGKRHEGHTGLHQGGDVVKPPQPSPMTKVVNRTRACAAQASTTSRAGSARRPPGSGLSAFPSETGFQTHTAASRLRADA